jgi:uncharacterized protein (UPF0332 family)
MISEFKRCLEKAKIVTFEKGPSLVEKELNSANDDLLSSTDSFERKNYKWATIQAYYSMFHTARALVYAKKYREKSHYCLVVALEHLYVEKGFIEKGILESLMLGKEMRESADYRSSFSKDGAENIIKAATNFLNITRKILGKK